MTRRQRRLHRAIWFILAPLLIGVFVLAVMKRQEYPVQAPPAAVGEDR